MSKLGKVLIISSICLSFNSAVFATPCDEFKHALLSSGISIESASKDGTIQVDDKITASLIKGTKRYLDKGIYGNSKGKNFKEKFIELNVNQVKQDPSLCKVSIIHTNDKKMKEIPFYEANYKVTIHKSTYKENLPNMMGNKLSDVEIVTQH